MGANLVSSQTIGYRSEQVLVVRKRSLQDRRLLHVPLTTKSQKLMVKLSPKHTARVVEEMSVLGAAEMAEIGRLCRKLGLGN